MEIKNKYEIIEVVQKDGLALRDVPDELKTPEMCLEAVRRDGRILELVPAALRTDAVLKAAEEEE